MSESGEMTRSGDLSDDPAGERAVGRSSERVEIVFGIEAVISLVVAILVAFAIFTVVSDARGALVQIGVGLAIALAFDGVLMKVMARFGWSRPIAVSFLGVMLLAVGVVTVVFLGPPAVREAQAFATSLPETVESLYRLPIIGSWLRDADAVQVVNDFVARLPSRISSDTISSAASTLVGGVTTVITVTLVAVTIMLDGERLVGLVRQAIPAAGRARADRIGQIVYQIIGKYFAGTITLAIMMGLYVLAICLIFGVPLAPLLAIWAMITNLIPQVGGFLGGFLLGVVAIASNPITGIIVVLLFIFYMSFDNHVIQPAIVGGAVSLSPPATMLAAFIGGAAAGVPGALLGTPLFGAAKKLYFELRSPGSVVFDETSGGGLRAGPLGRLGRLRRRGSGDTA